VTDRVRRWRLKKGSDSEMEPWNGWTLQLADGTQIEGPRPNGFRDIATEDMRMLTVFNDGYPFSVDLNGERRPVIVRRVQKRLSMASGGQALDDVVLGIGWRDEDDTSRVMVWVGSDGWPTLTTRHIKDLK
jgi:hypothetical protein